jgi:hypothetical protein
LKRFISLLVALSLIVLATPARAQSPGVSSPWNPVWSIPIDSIKRSYGASIVGLVGAASATDVFGICGSASTTVRVTRVLVAGRATAAANADLAIIKRSTADTGGTATNPAAIPYDSSIAAGTAVVSAYTANPTTGTAVGTLGTYQVNLGNLTTTLGPQTIADFGNRPASGVVLRGVAQCLYANLSGATFAGNLYNISVEWTEE